ncbi:MAG: hypothetical protein N3H31_06430 [Candidatus Nezhaarchaeota archaeon]|nr:hypothetical protein [Candidatus Nezhaarchaeota archaeon]
MKAKVIVITGPVGVGKSTVIKILTYLSKRKGLKTSSTFIKTFHGPSYLLWKIAEYAITSRGRRTLAPWLIVSRSSPSIARLLLLVSVCLDSIYIPFIMTLRVILPKFLGVTVFIEEYLLSTLLDYIYTFHRLKIRSGLRRFPLKILLSLCIKHKPDSIAVLNANLHELRRHWRIRGYGGSQINYVLFQRHFLPKLAHAFYGERAMEFDVALTSAIEIAEKIISDVIDI